MLLDFNIPTLVFLGPLGWPELLILAVIGVIIFGKRLPEVGKSIGRGIVEFKRGLAGIEEEIDEATRETRRIDQRPSEGASVDTKQSESQTTSTTDTSEPLN